ncbi:MAG TPA: helix-turn-helix domain-containing protein [Caulobacteraceae bacterium]|jgi:transcriptional regulator with XRE-family HTH domain|nr:helix-turn-helix domain-containing protein [Caulobacteraceae bacterium]
MISNLQIRAARALLGWSQQRLADEAGVSAITVKRLEASDEVFQARFETVMKVKTAVEGAGVVFRAIEGGLAHGVSLRQTSGILAPRPGARP